MTPASSKVIRRWAVPLLLFGLLLFASVAVSKSLACTGPGCAPVVAIAAQQQTTYPPPATIYPPPATVVPPTAVPPTAVPPTAVLPYPVPATATVGVLPTATAVAPRPATAVPPTAVIPRVTPPIPNTSGSAPLGATLPMGLALGALALAAVFALGRRLLRRGA